jgi:predicted transcriptional regulator
MMQQLFSCIREMTRLITVDQIMTPAAEVTTISAKETANAALQAMGSVFDQLPVLQDSHLVGVISRETLEAADLGMPVASLMAPLQDMPTVTAGSPLQDALPCLCKVRYALVTVKTDEHLALHGVVHFSDLNRHAARLLCYTWLSAMEMILANLVDRYHPDEYEWLKTQRDDTQQMLLGRWMFQQMHGVEIRLVEGLDFPILFDLLGKSKEGREACGLKGPKIQRLGNECRELRNKVMHSVRSLVSRWEGPEDDPNGDVHELRNTLESVMHFVEKGSEILTQVPRVPHRLSLKEISERSSRPGDRV